MADDELRRAEREWAADETNQPALARYVDARYRAGLPVTHPLLDRQVHGPRCFDLQVPAHVSIETCTGVEQQVGQTPVGGEGHFVPAHRALWVSPQTDPASAATALREAQGVHGIHLVGGETQLREILAELGGSPATRWWIVVRSGAPSADLIHSVARLPRLASLRLAWRNATFTAEHLGPLTRARHLSRLELGVGALEPGASGVLGGIAELSELTVTERAGSDARVPDVQEMFDLCRARSLRMLNLVGSEVGIDDRSLETLAVQLPQLSHLCLGSSDVTESGARALGGLPLEELVLFGSGLGDGLARTLAGLPLRRLYTSARFSPGGAALLPRTLEELTLEAPAGSGCLEWLGRLEKLRELGLNLLPDTTDDQLGPLSSARVERLSLTWAPTGRASSKALLHLLSQDELRVLQLFDMPDLEHAAIVLPQLRLERLGFTTLRALDDATLPALLPPSLRRLSIDSCQAVSLEALRALAAARPGLTVLRDGVPVEPVG